MTLNKRKNTNKEQNNKPGNFSSQSGSLAEGKETNIRGHSLSAASSTVMDE